MQSEQIGGQAVRDPDGTFSLESLAKIKQRRRLLRVWLAIQISAWVGLLIGCLVPHFGIVVALAVLIILATTFVLPFITFYVAVEMHGRGWAFVLAYVSAIAFVGWIMMIVLDMQATEVLERHGKR